MGRVLWPDGMPWGRPVERRRRWARRGRPWEAEFLNLDEVTDTAGGWCVRWTGRTARRGELVHDTLDEAMATVRWVFEQGGEWDEVDPDDARRVIASNVSGVRHDETAPPG